MEEQDILAILAAIISTKATHPGVQQSLELAKQIRDAAVDATRARRKAA